MDMTNQETWIAIRQAITPEGLEAVRGLMRSFVEWHKERHKADITLIMQYFDPVRFEAELAALPGKYVPPSGLLLLATVGDKPAGCGALHDLGGGVCEMKRLFVLPEAHGKGIGRQLAETLIAEARTIGYRTMRLDTGPLQREAQGLYRSLGFREIGCYYDTDPAMRDWLVFMERDLAGA